MGIMPVLPLRTALILLVAVPARANVIAALVVGNLVVANPLVLPVWYSLALGCGNLMVAKAVTWDRVSTLLETVQQAGGVSERLAAIAGIGWDIVIVLMSGGFLMALPAGVASYLLALRYFSRRQQSAAEPSRP